MGNSQSKLAQASPPLFERFTRIPLELRLKVYEYTLHEDAQPVLVDRCNDNTSEWLPELNVALLQVCHQVRDEAGSMYYKLNKFRFLKLEALPQWLSDLNAEQRNQIQDVDFKLEICETSAAALRPLAKCEGRRRLMIPFHYLELVNSVYPPRPPIGGWHYSDMGGLLSIEMAEAYAWIGRWITRPKYPTRREVAWMKSTGC